MTPFESFFGGNLFYINLARRVDRKEHFEAELAQMGITHCERFDAIDTGPGWGNNGCSASHRAVMDLIVQRQLPRAFVWEDDATLRNQFRDTFNIDVMAPLRELPEDFDMAYLGGHYGTMPRGWHSKHLILMGQMKTTSSYGVSLKAAKELRDIVPIGTSDSIDNLYGGYNETARCFISEPRFFYQYENYSNLQERVMANEGCMCDTSHVTRLGKYLPT